MTPEALAAAFLAMSPSDRAAFARAAGLANASHCGSRRTKGWLHEGTRQLVYAREGYRCYWCACDLRATGAHADHLTSERAGRPVYLIVVASCPACNVRRPADRQEAERVLQDIAGRDMRAARELCASEAGRAAYAAVKAASGMGRPAGRPARDGFPF